MNISEIAYQLGFSYPLYFSKYFKKKKLALRRYGFGKSRFKHVFEIKFGKMSIQKMELPDKHFFEGYENRLGLTSVVQ